MKNDGGAGFWICEFTKNDGGAGCMCVDMKNECGADFACVDIRKPVAARISLREKPLCYWFSYMRHSFGA
jgi:hypothetical protein